MTNSIFNFGILCEEFLDVELSRLKQLILHRQYPHHAEHELDSAWFNITTNSDYLKNYQRG
jgi:hypothetical protein